MSHDRLYAEMIPAADRNHRRRGGGRRFVRSALLVASLLVLRTLAYASDVTIVVSSDAAPYVAAQTAIEDRLAGYGHTTRRLPLSKLMHGRPPTFDGMTIIAVGTPAATYLQQHRQSSTSLIYCLVADPTAAGLGTGLPTYGISATVSVTTQFVLIAEALPEARSIGMLYRADVPTSVRHLEAARAALPAGWRLQEIAIDRSGSIAGAIDDLLHRDIDIVWTAADRAVYDRTTVRSLLLAALRHKIPVFGYSLSFVRAGALLGIAIDPAQQGVQAAGLAHDLIVRRSADPNRPPAFEIAVNSVVAEMLAIDLPSMFLERVGHVVP